jgi:hypothetical protein
MSVFPGKEQDVGRGAHGYPALQLRIAGDKGTGSANDRAGVHAKGPETGKVHSRQQQSSCSQGLT